ncbi:MAG TPA: tetratricopeptide repeat protein [Longimicrobiales bacterium]|nr:tetratricopeptide repeat protein [Longimicrobiales bacterium]
MSDRIDALRRMVESRPDDPRARFGLAVEYLSSGRTEEGVAALRSYLDIGTDEGNAWGRLASALVELDRPEEAREAWEKGIEVSLTHGHPTMAEEFRAALGELEG